MNRFNVLQALLQTHEYSKEFSRKILTHEAHVPGGRGGGPTINEWVNSRWSCDMCLEEKLSRVRVTRQKSCFRQWARQPPAETWIKGGKNQADVQRKGLWAEGRARRRAQKWKLAPNHQWLHYSLMSILPNHTTENTTAILSVVSHQP